MIFRFLLPFAAFLPVAAADVTGHWNFEGDVNGNGIRLECDMKQDGTRLEGTCKTPDAEIKVAGEVNDPKVRFSYAISYQGATYTLYYSGTLNSPAEMTGKIDVSGAAGTFTAKKEEAKK